jgi:two-component system response regulator YesN
MLADTDQDNIKNIRSYIRGTFADLKISTVLTEPSRDVMTALRDDAPDLIIADIRFFGVSGYALIRDIHDRYPNLRFIVYGYYNDSEYMEHSRDFGVLEYLYRPLRRADLSRCLNTAINYFERADVKRREKIRFEEHYHEHLEIYRELFMRDLLNGRIEAESEIYGSFTYFQMDYDKGFTVFLLRVEQFKKLILLMEEMEKHILSLKIAHIIRETASNYRIQTAAMDFNSVAAIMGGYEDLDKTISLCESIKDEIYKQMGIRVTVGLGRTYDSPSDIRVSYREAESALRYRFHLGENAVIPIHYMEPSNNITYRFPAEKESRLVFTAVIGEYNYCKVLLHEIFDALRACEPLPDKLLPKLVMSIIISINRYASEKDIPVQTNFTSFFPSKDVLYINDIGSAFEYLDNTLRNFCGFILDSHLKQDEEMVEKAKDICERRYYESASLPKIAQELGTTPEYVNRLFLDKEKKSVADFITGIRLREAKKLIRQTDLNDDMVAVKVGYDEGRQLRSVFRQYEGRNLSDYRSQYNAVNSITGRRR